MREGDYPTLSSAPALTSDSRRHSTMGISFYSGGNKLSYASNFITLRSGDILTSFIRNNRANFLCEKRYNEAYRAVYFLKKYKKNLISKSRPRPGI